MEIEQGSADARPGGELGSGRIRINRIEPDLKQGVCGVRVCLEALRLIPIELGHDCGFLFRGLSRERLAEGPANSQDRIVPRLSLDAFGEGAGGLDIGGVVEQNQGLQRCVGSDPISSTLLAGWGVEQEIADGEGIVSDHLGVETKAALAGEQAIVWVALSHGW